MAVPSLEDGGKQRFKEIYVEKDRPAKMATIINTPEGGWTQLKREKESVGKRWRCLAEDHKEWRTMAMDFKVLHGQGVIMAHHKFSKVRFGKIYI